MKNLLFKIILTTAFVLSTSAFFYVNYKYNKLKELKRTDSNSLNTSHDCAPLTGDLEWIKLSRAIEMISEYGANQASSINTSINSRLSREAAPGTTNGVFYDSRFVIFPMDTIKKFILAIDSMLNSFKPLNSDNTEIKPCQIGIKFFYASYPGLTANDPITNTYDGRHTLILVPSYLEATTDRYTEFFPSAIDNKRHPYTLDELISWDSAGSLKIHEVGTLSILAPDPYIGKNHGTLCPPPDNCFSAILQKAGGN
jgi:hypothetical protein